MTADWTLPSVAMAARIVLTLALMAGAGGAIIHLLLPPGDESARVSHPAYLAVAVAPAWVLLLTWGLKGADLYGFWIMGLALALTCLAGLVFRPAFRALLRPPNWKFNTIGFGYGLAVLAMYILFSPASFPLQTGSAIFLTQGWDLFLGRDPASVPFFGTWITVPLAYGEVTSSATFGLFSYAQIYGFFQFGIYWLSVFLAPLVPIGAYLYFARRLRWWMALIAAILFCSMILGVRMWSLRGESLGWICGFAFLVALEDLLADMRSRNVGARTVRFGGLLTVVLFSVSLTHGVVGWVVLFLALGSICSSALRPMPWRRRVSAAALGCGCGLLFMMLLLGYLRTYSADSRLVEGEKLAQMPGDLDAAIRFDAAWDGQADPDGPRVRHSGPYVDPAEIAMIAAFYPVSEALHRKTDSIALADFPDKAIRDLGRLPGLELATYFFLFAAALLLHGFLLAKRLAPRAAGLFWGSAAVYVFCIVLSLYLNETSNALFPVASMRRLLPYGGYFFWLMVALLVLDGAPMLFRRIGRQPVSLGKSVPSFTQDALQHKGHPEIRGVGPIPASTDSGWWSNSPGALPRLLERSLAQALAVWPSLLAAAPQSWRRIGQAYAPVARRVLSRHNIKRTVIALAFGAVLAVSAMPYLSPHSARAWFAARKGAMLAAFTGRESALPPSGDPRDLFAAVDYVKAHTRPGEWVYTNVISEQKFYFISSGRPSLLDGVSIYQLGRLLNDASSRIRLFSAFARTADLDSVAGYPFHYVMLQRELQCPGIACYESSSFPTNLQAFAENPRLERVFENTRYVVFERLGPPNSQSSTEHSK